MARQRQRDPQESLGETYQWRPGARFGVDAETAARELETIKRRSGGVLKPDDVVESAAAPSSPLHGEFLWEDDRAAHAHRLAQARRLINSLLVFVHIEEREEPTETTAYVHVGKREQGYESVGVALSDADMQRTVLDEALKYMEAGKRRWRTLRELSGVWEALDRAEEQVRQPRRKRGRPRLQVPAASRAPAREPGVIFYD